MKLWVAIGIIFFFSYLGIVSSTVIAEPKYVGIKGCKCHKSEISDWERSDHAKAFKLLRAGKKKSKKKKANLDPKKDFTNDKECLKCHVTGYNQEGGFIDIASTPDLAGVGCEMCHGPGSEYRKLHKTKGLTFTREEVKAAGQTYGSEDKAVCMKCHEHEDSPFKRNINVKYAFGLEERLEKIESYHELYELEGKH